MRSINNNKLISIAICTYNRADVISHVLDSLLPELTDDIEVIIIDNNSTDNLEEVTAPYTTKYKNISYAFEPQPGLSNARNKAVDVANGIYVAYIDDDAEVPTNWIPKAKEIIHELNPDGFGGPIYPFYLNQKPAWFPDEIEIRQHQRTESGWLPKDRYLSGSNMVFQKSLIRKVGGFDPSKGMVGDKTRYGEDTAFCYDFLEKGYNIYYDMDLIIKHLVPEYKQNMTFLLNRFLESGKEGYLTYKKSKRVRHFFNLQRDSRELTLRLEKVTQAANDALSKYKQSELKSSPNGYFIMRIKDDLWKIGFLLQAFEENHEDVKFNNVLSKYFNKLLDLSPRKFFYILRKHIAGRNK